MTRVRGVQDGEVLCASFDGRIKREFKDLKKTKVLLLVSMLGNEYCRGDYLEASIVNAINQHGDTTILLADQVYWNNLKSSDPIDDATQQQLTLQAIQLDDVFITENLSRLLRPLGINDAEFREQYGSLDINQQITKINDLARAKGVSLNLVRWADWVQGAGMQLTQVVELMDANPKMQKSIEKTAKEFTSRHRNEENPDIWLSRSLSYLREETPAVIWLSASRGYEFIAYPGDMIAPFETAKDIFINPKDDTLDSSLAVRTNQPLANWLDIHFRRTYSQGQLLQQSLLAASTTMGAKRTPAHSIGFFSAEASRQESDPERSAILSMVRSVLEAPGEKQFKLSVLMEAITVLGATQPATVSLNSPHHGDRI
jgi:hypothetical protein